MSTTLKTLMGLDLTDDRNLYVVFRLPAADLAHRSSFENYNGHTHVVYDKFGIEHTFVSEAAAEDFVTHKQSA